MIEIERLRQAWMPVSTKGTKDQSRWTATGLKCFASNRDCDNCTISQTMFMYWGGVGRDACHQPSAVQVLLSKNMRIPKWMLEEEGLIDPPSIPTCANCDGPISRASTNYCKICGPKFTAAAKVKKWA